MITEKTKNNHRYNELKLKLLVEVSRARATGITTKELAERTGLTRKQIIAAMAHYAGFYRKYFRRYTRKGHRGYYYYLSEFGLDIMNRLLALKKGNYVLKLSKR